MRKLIATAALLAATGIALPAMAQTGSSSSSSSTSVTASADLVCLSTAVEARESAVITAKTKFDAAIIAALQSRRDALKAALTITNTHDRQVAINAAWKVYMDAVHKARVQYQTEIRTAWKVYITARTSCHADSESAGIMNFRKNKHDDDRKHEKNDLHLSGSAKADAGIRARGLAVGTNAHVDLDFLMHD